MIATVTLNPSLDRTITVAGLEVDEANRWTKTLFIATFVFWLLPTIGLLFFAVKFWREKSQEEYEARAMP